jgi:hypothetical protein
MKNNYQDTSWMFGKPAAPTQQIDPRLLEKAHRPAQHQQITTLITAAWVVGGSTGLISLLASAPIIYLAHDAIPFVWLLIPASLFAGAVIGAVLSITWTREAATRAWRLEDEDRYYRFSREQQEQDQRAAAQAAPAAPPPAPPTDADRLRLAGYNILNYHFTTGRSATRPECETDLGVTQTEWNQVNKILIELNIKGERKWMVDQTDMPAAMLKWQRCVDIRPDGKAWIKDKPEQTQWRLIEL